MDGFPGSSFQFGTKNSLIDFGIKVIAYDPFAPPKRPRKQTIPFRNGAYDYGEKFYDEKVIRLDCVTENKVLSKEEMREVIYWLSKRSILRLWDEPEKYYVGEILESAEVQILPQRVKQQFTLPVICDPFAYSAPKNIPIVGPLTYINYGGTAETPTLIVLKNTTLNPISGVVINAARRIE